MDEERLRRELSEISRLVHQKGWVANHEGNLSARLDENRFLCTPTAVSKGRVLPEMLIVVDREGNLLSGTRKPFTEIWLHLEAYRRRTEINAVLHAHPPFATGFSVARIPLSQAIIPEMVVSLGPSVPIAPFALPFGKEAGEAISSLFIDHDAILLPNHGAVTLGKDLEQAYLRMEMVENLGRINLVARLLGNVHLLSREELAVCLERREKAGVGPIPKEHGAETEIPFSTPSQTAVMREDVEALVRREIERVFGKRGE